MAPEGSHLHIMRQVIIDHLTSTKDISKLLSWKYTSQQLYNSSEVRVNNTSGSRTNIDPVYQSTKLS